MTEFTTQTYPVLPLRDIVVFPHMIVPLFVGREKSVRALEAVMESDSPILLAAQKDPQKYRNLIVRIAGYSAYFVDLSPDLQNDLIARTEHDTI